MIWYEMIYALVTRHNVAIGAIEERMVFFDGHPAKCVLSGGSRGGGTHAIPAPHRP